MRNSWLRKGFQFATGNVLLQVVGFGTGIVVVRAASVQEYALYTVYTGLIFAMTSLSDSGVGGTLLVQGAKVRGNEKELAAWFRSGLIFRRRIGLWLSVFAVAVLVFLFKVNSASLWEMIAAAVIMIVTLEAVYQRGVWQVYFRLQLLAGRAQRILINSAVTRFFLVALALVLPRQLLVYLLITTALTYWLEAWLLMKEGKAQIEWGVAHHPDASRAFKKAFRQMLPMNLVNVLRGQSVVFLLSVLGSTLVVSQMAALSRFSMLFAVLNAIVLELLSPKIARLVASRRRTVLAMAQILMVYAACASLLVLCMIPLSDVILALLGPNYSNLNYELIVVSTGSVGINLAIAWGSLNNSRLWLPGSWTLVPLTIIWGLGGVLTLDLGSSTGAAIFTATQAVPLLLAEFIRSVTGYFSGTAESKDAR